MSIGHWVIGISIAANQFANALTGGSPIETISSREGRARERHQKFATGVCAVLNIIDHRHELPKEDHCQKAIRHERERFEQWRLNFLTESRSNLR